MGERRPKQRRTLLAMFAITVVVLAGSIPAFSSVGSANFETDDGNLEPNGGTPNFDWNSFAPVSWSGGVATKISSGWSFKGNTDKQATTTDDIFSGGVKQDVSCADVGTGKPNNKTDLKRIYLASKIVNSHTYLSLAWERIVQNTTSPSANVAFEFNRGETPCGGTAGTAGLVQRSADDPNTATNDADVLIVYDFKGGDDIPTLAVSRWITSGSCEITSLSAPCWGTYDTLAAGESEARVNTSTSVVDKIGPSGSNPGETLGIKEFGEAGIDLTAAGIFPEVGCITFGQNFAVSRTSGNSAQAQMKDLVGTDFTLTNCGSLKIVKKSGTTNLAGAKFKLYKDDGDGVFEQGTQDVQIKADGTNGSFECTTTSNGTGDCTWSNLLIGGKYWVYESQAPSGYVTSTTNPSLQTIADSSELTVTFQNAPATKTLKIVKRDDAGNLMDNVQFTLAGTSDAGNAVNLSCTTGVSNSSGSVTPATGECSFLNVEVGSYTLSEGSVPDGYAKDASLPKTVTLTTSSASTVTVNVENPRKHRVIVIVCHEGTNTLIATDVQNGTSTKTSIGTAPTGITEAQLCNLGGASFGGLGHGDKTVTAKIAAHTP